MEVMATTFEAFNEAHLPDVLAIEAAVFSAPWSAGMFTDELAAPGRRYLVATQDDSVIGYGGVMVIDGDAHIMNLAVVVGARRRGLATALLIELIDCALELGASHLTLELRVSNTPALSLYEKFGFAPVGVRPGYYGDEDALVMWALDVDGPDYRAALDRIREEAA